VKFVQAQQLNHYQGFKDFSENASFLLKKHLFGQKTSLIVCFQHQLRIGHCRYIPEIHKATGKNTTDCVF